MRSVPWCRAPRTIKKKESKKSRFPYFNERPERFVFVSSVSRGITGRLARSTASGNWFGSLRARDETRRDRLLPLLGVRVRSLSRPFERRGSVRRIHSFFVSGEAPIRLLSFVFAEGSIAWRRSEQLRACFGVALEQKQRIPRSFVPVLFGLSLPSCVEC